MNTSLSRAVLALLMLTFVLAACSSSSGTAWTFAPVVSESDEAASSAAPAEVQASAAAPAEPQAPAEASTPPAEPEAPAETDASAEPEAPAVAAGEPRVIALQADSALRFTDADGQPIPDIPVVPGETVRFEIDNTAGFPHNFYIGTDEELQVFDNTTDVGIPDWSSGVQTLDWVVPDDLTGLKFACTVAGHFYTMQGTFSPAEASAAAPAEPQAPAEASTPPAEPEAPAETDASAEPEAPAVAAGEPRVIALQADSALRFTDADGQPIPDIPVVPGETVRFEIDNTAGFPHNFYIGTDEELQVFDNTTDVGIPDWSSGVQTLDWVVPDDLTGLKFACTVAGHFYTMQGTFSEIGVSAEAAASVPPEESADSPAPVGSVDPDQMAGSLPATDGARVIELEADPAIRFLQDGKQIREIGVTPGETVVFRIENTAGFPHNFYIGTDEELQVFGNTTDTGLPDWSTGVQELEWTVPDDISNLRFACTVAGHYFTMQGDFTVSP